MASQRRPYTKTQRNIYRRGATFQVKLQVNGAWISETFDTESDAEDFRDLKRVAKNRDPDFARVVAARAAKRAANKLLVAGALTKYEDEVTAKKKKTQPERSRISIITASKLGQLPFGLVEGPDIQAFLDSLQSSDANKLKYVAILSHLYNVARKQWHLKVANPVNDIVKPKPGKGRERRVEPAEYALLLRTMTSAHYRNRELAQLFRLARATACRPGELVNLERNTVDLVRGSITVLAMYSKTGKTRTVPLLTDDAHSAIGELLVNAADRRTRLFASTQEALRQVWYRVMRRARRTYQDECRAAGILEDPTFLKDLRLYDLRHEAISSLFEETDLRDLEIAAIAGHANLNTTAKYTHLRAHRMAARMQRAKAAAPTRKGPLGAEISGAFGGEKDTGGGRDSGSDAWKPTCGARRIP
jgi:integrase